MKKGSKKIEGTWFSSFEGVESFLRNKYTHFGKNGSKLNTISFNMAMNNAKIKFGIKNKD